MLACFTRRVIVVVIDLLLISFGLWFASEYLRPCPVLLPRDGRIFVDYLGCGHPTLQGWEGLILTASIGILSTLSARLAKCATMFRESPLLEYRMRLTRNI